MNEIRNGEVTEFDKSRKATYQKPLLLWCSREGRNYILTQMHRSLFVAGDSFTITHRIITFDGLKNNRLNCLLKPGVLLRNKEVGATLTPYNFTHTQSSPLL